MKPTTDDAILQVRGLTVRFGSLVAVDGVDFDAQRGHITAVIGPNGAGKSSLFNLISGAIRPSVATVAAAKHAAERTKAKKLISVAGGGDTVAALNQAGVAGDFSYVSTAGGAFLEWMEGKPLPGVEVLKTK